MKRLVKISGGQSQVLEGKVFERERELQEIVKNHPEIIPLEELGEEFKPILIIGQEFPLGDAGFVDLIGVDDSGLITIIEFKLEKNTDIRKAVAQTLEYAANLWEMSYDDLDRKACEYFRSDRCADPEQKEKKSLAEAICWHHKKTIQDEGEGYSEADFKTALSTNLRKGQFRLMLFCDEVDARTKRTVEYLHTLSRYDFYCASANFFQDGSVQLITPFLVTKERDDKKSGKQHAGKITFEEFLRSIPEQHAKFRPIYEKFNDDLVNINGYLSMGTKGFGAYFPARESFIKLFEGYPDDVWIITKSGMAKKEELIPHEAMLDFEESMKKMPHFKEALIAQGKHLRYRFSKITPENFENLLRFYFLWRQKWFANEGG